MQAADWDKVRKRWTWGRCYVITKDEINCASSQWYFTKFSYWNTSYSITEAWTSWECPATPRSSKQSSNCEMTSSARRDVSTLLASTDSCWGDIPPADQYSCASSIVLYGRYKAPYPLSACIASQSYIECRKHTAFQKVTSRSNLTGLFL